MTTTTQFITCTRCQKDKLFTEFYHDKHKRNGRKSWCRQCVKEYNWEYGRIRYRQRRELRSTWGVVTRLNGKPYTAVFVAPYGFTSEATRAGIRMVNE